MLDYYEVRVGLPVITREGRGTIAHVGTGCFNGAVWVKLDVSGREIIERSYLLKRGSA